MEPQWATSEESYEYLGAFVAHDRMGVGEYTLDHQFPVQPGVWRAWLLANIARPPQLLHSAAKAETARCYVLALDAGLSGDAVLGSVTEVAEGCKTGDGIAAAGRRSAHASIERVAFELGAAGVSTVVYVLRQADEAVGTVAVLRADGSGRALGSALAPTELVIGGLALAG